jgi:cyclopropane-fatty-acyl-phospholipid synthase
MVLPRLFRPLIKSGRLTIIDAGGRRHDFGENQAPHVVVRLHDPALPRRLAMSRQVALGEAFMDGLLTIEQGSLYDFLSLLTAHVGAFQSLASGKATRLLSLIARRIQQFNPVKRARKNVAHHYDLSEELYRLFLDADMQYSCAYFLDETDTLDAAQLQKKRHIAAKLRLQPMHRVLDIGSGWGGLGLFLADRFGADVTGITLSAEQLRVANERARQARLADRLRFEVRDYREQQGRFDRIVSVGMFEHVGVNHFRTFFATIHGLLADDGVALLHTIGRVDGPGVTDPWMRKYIFPGGYIPALSEIVAAVEKEDLWITDVEVLRMHYAETLRCWRERFLFNRERARQLYDERFCRMWEFYLAGSEVAFRHLGLVVFQIQLAKRPDALPLIRDYMVDDERRMTAAPRGGNTRAA